MRKLVVDASVSLEWQFKDEEQSVAAAEMLLDFVNDRVQLLAPTLWAYEVVNEVRSEVLRGRSRRQWRWRREKSN